MKADWRGRWTKDLFDHLVVNSSGEVLVSSTSDKRARWQDQRPAELQKVSVEGLKPFEVYTLPVTLQPGYWTVDKNINESFY